MALEPKTLVRLSLTTSKVMCKNGVGAGDGLWLCVGNGEIVGEDEGGVKWPMHMHFRPL